MRRHRFKWDNARQVKVGMTTDEVVQLMGKPRMVASRDGTVIYVWSYVGLGFSHRSLRVDFKGGKVIATPEIPDEFKD